MSLAFLRPSDFSSKTHRFLMTFLSLGRSARSYTLRLRSASSSSQQTFFHSFCSALGKLAMSRKVHSRILRTGLRFSTGTACESKKLINSTPPSRHSCAICSSGSDTGFSVSSWCGGAELGPGTCSG